MPIEYARQLTSANRTFAANRRLGCVLAFVAGATNAGGFLAVHQYTSHMTGIVSAIADNAVLGSLRAALAGTAALGSFIAGAACSAVMIHFARRAALSSEFALPLLLEAVLLMAFGVMGARLATIGLLVPATVMLLCFIMGLQNAVITKISRAEIRTTHITGVVTDIGIELGRLIYWNRDRSSMSLPVRADRQRLGTLATLAVSFFGGGIAGAVGFKHAGYVSTLPLALVLMILAIVPAIDDIRRAVRVFRSGRR